MKVNLKGKKVAVEKTKKQKNNQSIPGLVIIPDSEEYLGHIIYVGPDADSTLKPGQKVYFSTNYQQCRMDGKDLCVMEDKEIFATVED